MPARKASRSTSSGRTAASSPRPTAPANHLTATAFETDRRRDAILQVAGLRVVRFTWRQLDERQREVEQTLRRLLGRRTR
jgi:acyl-CoA synthetase (AMP-forming)/AMP-acid ligase II